VTATDQDEAAERSARELERRLRMILPPSLLADAYAFAMAFKRWELERDWRCWPRSQTAIQAARPVRRVSWTVSQHSPAVPAA
jgi:hypothetical protein